VIILAVFLFLLAILAFAPLFIVLLGHFEGSGLFKLEALITNYDGTIASLGTLFLVSSLAVVSSIIVTNHATHRDKENDKAQKTREDADRSFALKQQENNEKNARAREYEHRKITSVLKISEFRQAWINELRETLSDFQSIAMEPNSNPADERSFYKLGTKIKLLMNPEDSDYSTLEDLMYKMLAVEKGDLHAKYSLNPEFIDVSQKILKREWERLKGDLRNATLVANESIELGTSNMNGSGAP